MANLICNPGEKIWSKVKKKTKEICQEEKTLIFAVS